MDWSDVGKIVGPLAPTLGGILGGVLLPGLGGTIGTEAGQILANALGVPNTPDAVGGAIANDPNASAKIAAAETEAAAKWSALADIAKANAQSNSEQSTAVNATMRAELASGQPFWAWRNIYGYSVSVECAGVACSLFYGILFDKQVMANMVNSFSFLITWYSLRFGLLGYIHNQATQEKVAAVTGQQPAGIVNSIIKAVKAK